MFLLFILIQIQLIAIVVIAIVLRLTMINTVHRIVIRNSTRIDGTMSRRRQDIENKSINNLCVNNFWAMLSVFAIFTLLGMLAVGLLALNDGSLVAAPVDQTALPAEVDEVARDFMTRWQWPLIIINLFLAFFLFPPFISFLYRRSIREYNQRAKRRYLDYYRNHSVETIEACSAGQTG